MRAPKNETNSIGIALFSDGQWARYGTTGGTVRYFGMQARQGVTLNHGKPKPSKRTASARNPAPDECADGGSGNRSIRTTALQQGLRAAYRTVVEEPLPDRLLALLQQLDGDGSGRR